MVRVLFAALVLLSTTSADDLLQRAQKRFKPIPNAPPVLKANPITPEKVELGRLLFLTRDSRLVG